MGWKTACSRLQMVGLVLLFGGQAQAAEVDSVTPRSIPLEDSLSQLNTIFNERLQEGVARANARQKAFTAFTGPKYCDPEVLYAELRKAFFQSFTASWGLKGYDFDRQLRELLVDRSYSLSLQDSIYRDIDYLEGFSLNLKELSDVVRVGGHLVGIDKFGHFLAEGYHYFALTADEGKNLSQAMDWGREQEAGKYGYATTGIFSYADLVANFQGYRFWNRVLAERRDPLRGFFADLLTSPYVSCNMQIVASVRQRRIVKAWEVKARFDLSDYLDGMWDEGNNCNSYADPAIEAKVSARITGVNKDFSCPVTPDSCVEAGERYGRYAKQLLHPSCLTATVSR